MRALTLLLLCTAAAAFNIVVRTPPEEILASVLQRFPPLDSDVYKKKEYMLRVSNFTGLPGNKNPCEPNTFMTAPNMHPLYIREVHHFALGRPWMLGREIFEWVVHDLHLAADETVLEFGCGALSTGIWLIEYLRPGKYFGMEPVKWLFDAGKEYEVPLHMLEHKAPTLIHTPTVQPDFSGVPNTQFDRMFALTAFHPLPPASAQAKATLTALGRRLRPGGRLYVAGELPLPLEGLPSVGLQLARSAELHCQWVACDFPWFELTARP